MTLDELLSIQATIDKRAVPIDILEEDYEYYSRSKDKSIKLLDLHLIHFIRIFLKLVEENNKSIDKDKLNKVRMSALDLLGDIHSIEQDME